MMNIDSIHMKPIQYLLLAGLLLISSHGIQAQKKKDQTTKARAAYAARACRPWAARARFC